MPKPQHSQPRILVELKALSQLVTLGIHEKMVEKDNTVYDYIPKYLVLHKVLFVKAEGLLIVFYEKKTWVEGQTQPNKPDGINSGPIEKETVPASNETDKSATTKVKSKAF